MACLAGGAATILFAGRLYASDVVDPQQSRALMVDGARLWPIYCAQCHNARPGAEFSKAQWTMILMHMRTQSVMPAKDIRAIKEFLDKSR